MPESMSPVRKANASQSVFRCGTGMFSNLCLSGNLDFLNLHKELET
jgi:hypothetical protein